MKANGLLSWGCRLSRVQALVPRRAVLAFACLGIALAACASVPGSRDSFVVLESSKFT